MKIALIEPKAPGVHVYAKFKLPRLGLPLLGAMLERELGIRPTIYFQELSGLDWDELAECDLVGISTITPTAPEAFSILERIKQRSNTPVVMGGPHVTFLPLEALERGADYVIRGEGEFSFLELVKALDGRGVALESIPGLSYRMGSRVYHNPEVPRVEHLDDLPWPDLTMIKNHEKIRILPVMTSRGCPYNCKFCSVTKMFGRRYRFRDTADVLDELEALHRVNPRASFFFYDDNFTARPSRTKDLLRGMIERGIKARWTAQARVDVVKDTEMLELMRDSGCMFLYLGLESINPRTLESYRKEQTVQDIAEAVKILHSYRIRVHGMFVLGSDEDDLDTIRETVRFARSLKIDTVQFLVLTPLPGTETYEELWRQGRILVEDWSKYSGHHVVFSPSKMTPYQLQKEASIRSMRRFYSLWQCWKLGLRFRWWDFVIYAYAHHSISRWRSLNREFLRDLKHKHFRLRPRSPLPPVSDLGHDTGGT
ncbi:MAG: B12-binding domain-containing radical SAM protein [Actinobacteria bacterium]|nr:B12-binding domain-containing radical SAM protein [Actinomycetota bacterium]MDI6830809.1 radical SAM protein [Actinomycetota bacterium]